MDIYLQLLKKLLETGIEKSDRTGVGTRSLFGEQLRFDLQAGFPLLTTKKVHFRSVLVELLWFLRGDTNIQFLLDHKVTIWNEWADERGELGPVYGKQWRAWQCPDGRIVDQIRDVERRIIESPDSRRLIVSAWNVADLDRMALPPCHLLFQFYVACGRLSCHLYQRSADVFLGVPFNIASYALLVCMMANTTDLEPGELILSFGDVHLYRNHFEQARIQLSREPKPLPSIRILRRPASVTDYSVDDFELLNYAPHPHIPAPVAV